LGYVYSVKKWDSTIILLSMYHILTKVNNKLMTHKIKGHKEKIKKKDQEERNGKLKSSNYLIHSYIEKGEVHFG